MTVSPETDTPAARGKRPKQGERRVQILHAHAVYTHCFAVPWARLAGGPAVIASRRYYHTVPRPELPPAAIVSAPARQMKKFGRRQTSTKP